ncbi:MAG TPA: hypothetical protein VNK50_03960 [Calidithermus sp.]|jgi:Cu/Ag efflux protein CusF|nr:hypothetical protein [Calidithermus sp.]
MTLKTWTAAAALLALAAGPAGAQGRSDAPAAPEKIEGTVTAIDQKTGTVTLRGDNGQTFQFRGDAETLKDLRVGQKIELTKRAEPKK